MCVQEYRLEEEEVKSGRGKKRKTRVKVKTFTDEAAGRWRLKAAEEQVSITGKRKRRHSLFLPLPAS